MKRKQANTLDRAMLLHAHAHLLATFAAIAPHEPIGTFQHAHAMMNNHKQAHAQRSHIAQVQIHSSTHLRCECVCMCGRGVVFYGQRLTFGCLRVLRAASHQTAALLSVCTQLEILMNFSFGKTDECFVWVYLL